MVVGQFLKQRNQVVCKIQVKHVQALQYSAYAVNVPETLKGVVTWQL